jgi:hypothetical protein
MDIGAAEFLVMAAFDLAAQLRGHGHLAIADAQHRHAHLEHGLRRARGVFFVNRTGAAGENDGTGLFRQRLLGLVEGHDLAIDARLAHAPRYQLGDLAAEIQNQNAHLLLRAVVSGWSRLRSDSAFWAAASAGSMSSAAS